MKNTCLKIGARHLSYELIIYYLSIWVVYFGQLLTNKRTGIPGFDKDIYVIKRSRNGSQKGKSVENAPFLIKEGCEKKGGGGKCGLLQNHSNSAKPF